LIYAIDKRGAVRWKFVELDFKIDPSAILNALKAAP
jgi:hypothetical protein